MLMDREAARDWKRGQDAPVPRVAHPGRIAAVMPIPGAP